MSDAERDDAIVVSTKERPGPFDGFETAKPGEPIFVIQGGDPFGPPTVIHWARLARAAGLDETNKKRARRLLRRATNAEEVAWAMQSYQRGEAEIAGRAIHYNDSGDDGGEGARERHAILVKGADKLHNSLAEALLIAEDLAKLREFPEAEVKIREAVEALKEAAFDIEPRRHLRRQA